MAPVRIPTALLALALSMGAQATVLYKSVGPNGVVEFSDTPPAASAKIIEQREIRSATPAGTASLFMNSESGTSRASSMETLANDEEVLRASAQVDLAEHALALARRAVWAPMDGLKLRSISRTTSDEERIEYYKRGVTLARQNLVDVLKRRASVLSAPGMPIVTAISSR